MACQAWFALVVIHDCPRLLFLRRGLGFVAFGISNSTILAVLRQSLGTDLGRSGKRAVRKLRPGARYIIIGILMITMIMILSMLLA